jgi:hypothetical protein
MTKAANRVDTHLGDGGQAGLAAGFFDLFHHVLERLARLVADELVTVGLRVVRRRDAREVGGQLPVGHLQIATMK